MEIERKWMVKEWPRMPLELLYTELQEQGYVHVSAPIVRIRREERIPAAGGAEMPGISSGKAGENGQTGESAQPGAGVRYVLCLKSAGRLARQEIETDISEETFHEIREMIGLPLISKVRRTYQLPDGLQLEVNLVDEGSPSEFMYAEIEYGSVEEARGWDPSSAGLADYLSDDVTEKPGQSMSVYWVQTRLSMM